MLRDKKAHNGKLNLVLLRAIGQAELFSQFSGERLIEYFGAIAALLYKY